MDAANQRIAKNTIFLYIRTIVILLVSLYTSRVILEALGVTDLGIYNVVGGIVTLVSSLQAAQTSATSRFITFELGKVGASDADLKRIFSICLTIHILLALLVLVFAESVGLVVINKFIEVPPERIFAANVVYQFSVVTLIAHLIRVPYGSVIIAHERMSIYAYVAVVEAVLLLALALGVKFFDGDHLILYSFGVSFIALVLFAIYYFYVRYQFSSYKFKWIWDKKESLRVLSFSGWTLLGSTSDTIEQQGVSLLLNKFVGLVANTALGFANQVSVAVGKFVKNFSTAFNPQIIKYYSSDEKCKMFRLINRASKYSFMLCYVMALPLIANMDFVLSIWLKEVPQYTVEFCQLILACTIIDATTGVLNTSITASGKIKGFQIAISVSFLCDFLMALGLLLLHANPVLVFGVRIMMRGILNMLIEFYYCDRLLDFNLKNYIREVFFPIIITLLLTIPPIVIICKHTAGIVMFLLTCFAATSINSICLLYIIMTKTERTALIDTLKSKVGMR